MLLNYRQALEACKNDYGIKMAVAEGKLFKIEAGVYSTTLVVSEEAILSFKYPNGVVTLGAAFYLHGLTDVPPEVYDMATSRDSAKIIDPRVRQVFTPKRVLDIGKTVLEKNGTIDVYDLERCLIELFRYKTKLPYDFLKRSLET